jgi:cell surface protein SprA
MDENWSAPGWGFVLGDQDPNIRYRAAEKGLLTTSNLLTMPFQQIRSEMITLRANMEPSPDLKIQLDVKKENTSSYQEIFRDTLAGDDVFYHSLNPSRGGSYKISFNTIRTAFDGSNNRVESDVFRQFEENLGIIHERFADARDLPRSEVDTIQDVVIPAFIAAYSGKDAYAVSFAPFPKTPMPNWRIDYSGLNKIDALKEIFQSITLSHGYQSTYSVVSYNNSLEFEDPSEVGIDRSIENYNRTYFGKRNEEGQFVPVYVISSVMISEQFSPLIGINVRTKGRLTARAEYKTKRDLSLNIPNAQIMEMNSKDVSLELGYTKNNLKLPFRSQGRTIVLKNDVTFRLNVTISDTKTIQRKIAELAQITNGNVNFQLRPNISYVVNQKLTLQAYFERTVNTPSVTNSFPRATTRFGIQIRFSLAQ